MHKPQRFIPLFLLGAIALFLWPHSACAAEGKVIASIKPLHSLVAAVMGDTGKPVLLVGGLQSPHGYQLKPSQIDELQHADIIFYIGPGLETFLARPLETLPTRVRQVAMVNAPGVTAMKPRAGAMFEADDDPGESGPNAQDPHIWLEVNNAKAITAEIVKDLSALYPANAKTYAKNAGILINKLDALDRELKLQLAPVRNKPYIVFHDAFHYFEKDYGLTAVGSITLEPEQEPSAARIAAIRDKVKSLHVACVFSEPQFNARLAQTVTEGTNAHVGVIDEHGADIKEGPDLYITLMHHVADSFVKCLQ